MFPKRPNAQRVWGKRWLRAMAAPRDGEIQLESIPVNLAAAEGEGKLRKFSMVAYTGQKMNVAGFWDAPVVIDLNGMKKGNGKKPILLDHDPRQRVGHSEAVSVNGASMGVDGVISGASPAAEEVSLSSANGFPWQASVGLMVSEVTFVKEGKSVTVNGQHHEGPVYVARKSTLKEVSFVTMGADDHTSAKVAASAKLREQNMNEFEKWLQAMELDAATLTEAQAKALKAKFDAEVAAKNPTTSPVTPPAATPLQASEPSAEDVVKVRRQALAAEEKRVAAILKAAEQHPEIRAQAIAEGWTDVQTELAVIKAERAKPPAIHSSSTPLEGIVVEAALAQAGGMQNLDKRFKPEVLEAAHKQYQGRISLQEILLQAARQSGYSYHSPHQAIRGNLKDVLKAAFSTISLPGILSNTANKSLLDGFTYAEQAWRAISSVSSANDFKQMSRYRLTDNMVFEKVGKSGEIKHGTVGEETFTNQVETYGKMLSITREDIINDDLGALTAVPRLLGTGAGDALNDVFWADWLDDASFFSTGNANYITGAGTTLQISQLDALNLKFAKQTKPNGKPLGMTPSILLVPPELWATALELMQSTTINTGGAATATQVPNKNIWAGRFQVVMSAYLTSATAWYLLADPMRLSAIEVAFLNGVQSPTVENAEADFNKLGIQMRAYMDFGTGKQDYRAAAKSKGAT